MLDMIEFAAFFLAWCKFHYYRAALNHVGHSHPDAPYLTMRLADCERCVNGRA